MIFTRGMIFERPLFDGVQRLYRFDNGYGAIVTRHLGSYGGPRGLWEVAVIVWNSVNNGWDLCYSTPITDDVIEYLEEDQVNTVLSFIEKLNGSGEFNNDEDARAWEKFSDEL